jgi:hypothetical protein
MAALTVNDIWYDPPVDAPGSEANREAEQNELYIAVGGDVASCQTQCLELAALYDQNNDACIDEEEFENLIEDLLCLRDRVLNCPPFTKVAAARTITDVAKRMVVANKGLLPATFPSQPMDAGMLAILAQHWDRVLRDDAVKSQLGGNHRLCFLHDPSLIKRVETLRTLRQSMMDGMDGPIGIGSHVRLKGLKARPELNGRLGNVSSYNSETLRWTVDLTDKGSKPVSLKADNLEAVDARDEQLRRQSAAKAVQGVWVYDRNPNGLWGGSCFGQPVSEDSLQSRGGFHFNDHGNGEGMVYWWPPREERERLPEKHQQVVAYPVVRSTHIHGPFGSSPGQSPVMQTSLPRPSPMLRRSPSDPPDAPPAAAPMSTQEVYDIVNRNLAAKNMKAVECGAGGNCFFYVLSVIIYGIPHRYDYCRKETVRYMREHREDFEGHVVLASTYEAYCDLMEQDGTYVEGQVEIFAAVHRFNVNLDVHGMFEPNTFRVTTSTSATRNGRVVHYDAPGADAHYNLAVFYSLSSVASEPNRDPQPEAGVDAALGSVFSSNKKSNAGKTSPGYDGSFG